MYLYKRCASNQQQINLVKMQLSDRCNRRANMEARDPREKRQSKETDHSPVDERCKFIRMIKEALSKMETFLKNRLFFVETC